MSGSFLVLDAGVIDRATTDRAFRSTLLDLAEHGWDAVIPTVVLAEAVTGSSADAAANLAVKRIGTQTTDEPTARLAGRLRAAVRKAEARRLPSGIDAIVAAHAVGGARSIVFTTDPTDLGRLLDGQPHVEVARP